MRYNCIMQNDFIPEIEPTPTFKTKRCLFLVNIIGFKLTYMPTLLTVMVAFIVDYFFAVATLLVSYLVTGIIRSYMRNNSIPKKQQEYSYSDKAIAAWFLYRTYCFGQK
ncbi:MAG: hypothetical protein MUP09_03420 [Thiovulaceae bacterium]|nr:hypothetical protein [Sulfurimonadaceae bacterium]